MRTTHAVSALVFSCLFVSTAFAIGPTTTFSDGGFDDSQWTFTSIANDSGDGFVLSSQIAAGGNPDEYREVTNSVVTSVAQTRNTVV